MQARRRAPLRSRRRARCPSRTGSGPEALRRAAAVCLCVQARPRTRLPLDMSAGLRVVQASARPLRVLLRWRLGARPVLQGLPVSRTEGASHPSLAAGPAASAHPPEGAAAAFLVPSCGCFSFIRGWLEAGGRGRGPDLPAATLGPDSGEPASPDGKTHPLLFCHQFEVLEDLKYKSSLNTLSSPRSVPSPPCLSTLLPCQPAFLKEQLDTCVHCAHSSSSSVLPSFATVSMKVSLKKLLLSS